MRPGTAAGRPLGTGWRIRTLIAADEPDIRAAAPAFGNRRLFRIYTILSSSRFVRDTGVVWVGSPEHMTRRSAATMVRVPVLRIWSG